MISKMIHFNHFIKKHNLIYYEKYYYKDESVKKLSCYHDDFLPGQRECNGCRYCVYSYNDIAYLFYLFLINSKVSNFIIFKYYIQKKDNLIYTSDWGKLFKLTPDQVDEYIKQTK